MYSGLRGVVHGLLNDLTQTHAMLTHQRSFSGTSNTFSRPVMTSAWRPESTGSRKWPGRVQPEVVGPETVTRCRPGLAPGTPSVLSVYRPSGPITPRALGPWL